LKGSGSCKVLVGPPSAKTSGSLRNKRSDGVCYKVDVFAPIICTVDDSILLVNDKHKLHWNRTVDSGTRPIQILHQKTRNEKRKRENLKHTLLKSYARELLLNSVIWFVRMTPRVPRLSLKNSYKVPSTARAAQIFQVLFTPDLPQINLIALTSTLAEPF
jgi:hypothetical protein